MKKIAIVNRTNFKNFGSVLQCLALCNTVEKLGYSSEIIWCKGGLSKNFDIRPRKVLSSLLRAVFHPHFLMEIAENIKFVSTKKYSVEEEKLFEEFIENNIRQQKYTWRELCRMSDKDSPYSAFICGSDQIWCSTSLYVDPMLYLRFAPERKRIAYAPSIGRDYIPGYNRRIMKRYVSEIPYLSIREDCGCELVHELTGKEVVQVLDPTLLIDKDEWVSLSRNVALPESYCLCYFLDTASPEVQRNILAYSQERGLKIVALGCTLPEIPEDLITYPSCGPAEFLAVISRAAAVFTDSYHGMLFSIIFRKNFLAIPRNYIKYDQSSRQRSVLNMLGLSMRYGSDFSLVDGSIDYNAVNKKIDMQRQVSLSFLKSAILGMENGK